MFQTKEGRRLFVCNITEVSVNPISDGGGAIIARSTLFPKNNIFIIIQTKQNFLTFPTYICIWCFLKKMTKFYLGIPPSRSRKIGRPPPKKKKISKKNLGWFFLESHSHIKKDVCKKPDLNCTKIDWVMGVLKTCGDVIFVLTEKSKSAAIFPFFMLVTSKSACRPYI